MHHPDMSVPLGEVWQALDLLVQQGKVLGSQQLCRRQIATTQAAATARGSLGLVSEQSYYNLMERTVELEVLPACRHLGIGLVCWSPLNRGLLGGTLRTESMGRRSRPEARDKVDRYRPQLEA